MSQFLHPFSIKFSDHLKFIFDIVISMCIMLFFLFLAENWCETGSNKELQLHKA